MRLWRVVLPRRADDALSGEGARRFGGRWNRIGQPAVYGASTPSLAVLEWRVHVDLWDAPDELVLLGYEVPDAHAVTRYTWRDLPGDWRTYPAPEDVRMLGARWLDAAAGLVLAVPSAVLPIDEEENLMVNPRHSGFSQIREVHRQTVTLDPRLFTS